MLSFASGSAIKRITAGVKAAADRPCQSFDLRPAFTLPANSVPNEKRILLSVLADRVPASVLFLCRRELTELQFSNKVRNKHKDASEIKFGCHHLTS